LTVSISFDIYAKVNELYKKKKEINMNRKTIAVILLLLLAILIVVPESFCLPQLWWFMQLLPWRKRTTEWGNIYRKSAYSEKIIGDAFELAMFLKLVFWRSLLNSLHQLH
jgi:Na+/proline symporter